MQAKTARSAAMGAAAGLIGTVAMMGFRTFDSNYAADTVPEMEEDPGQFVVRQAERITGHLPKSVEQAGAVSAHTGYGTLFGVLYGLTRGVRRDRSSLLDGIVFGSVVYAASYLGLLPAIGISKPVWRQTFPEVVGEHTRHVVYGVITAAAYNVINDLSGHVLSGLSKRETSHEIQTPQQHRQPARVGPDL